MKTVKLKITDHNGHTEKNITVTEAVDVAVEQHFKAGKWAYVGSTAFQFSATNPKDDVRLAQDKASLGTLLENIENPTLVMAGDLQGGAPSRSTRKSGSNRRVARKASSRADTVKNEGSVVESTVSEKPLMVGKSTIFSFKNHSKITITKQPLSVLLSSSTTDRPQLAINVQTVGGKSRVNVFVSDYNEGFSRLKKHLEFISSSINDILLNDTTLRNLLKEI